MELLYAIVLLFLAGAGVWLVCMAIGTLIALAIEKYRE